MFSAAAAMSNLTALSEDANVSYVTKVQNFDGLNSLNSSITPQQPQKIKKKRGLPGNPDPDAEVIALSPKTLLATNRFVCEVCNKGFQRDQNLQLHRRGHNLPWKLKKKISKETRKKVYVCPESSCVHHHPSRALGDLTGIKKHFCRKHGEKKWKCEKCSKTYAVQSDWKAHSKTCGTREYRCDCGTLFSRKDSFITHRAFCDALAQESARVLLAANQLSPSLANTNPTSQALFPFPANLTPWNTLQSTDSDNPSSQNTAQAKAETQNFHIPFPPLSSFKETQISHFKNLLHPTTQLSSNSATSAHLSATALLQKAAVVGANTAAQQPQSVGHMSYCSMNQLDSASHLDWQKTERLTRDFLGLTDDSNGRCGKGNVTLNVTTNMGDMLTYAGGFEFQQPLMKNQDFGFEPDSETWGNC